MLTRPRSVAARGAAFALLLALAPRAPAQEFKYELNEFGKLVVNGTVLDALKSDFDPSMAKSPEQRWWDLAVVGADRYALRLDGRLSRNGKNLYKLPFVLVSNAPVWSGLSVTPAAPITVYAIRTDGLLTGNGAAVQNFTAGNFFFQRCLAVCPAIYSLRSDGSIYKDTTTTPIIKFVAGTGAGGATDGQIYDTLWFAIAANPSTGEIFALRRDGHLWKQDPTDSGTKPLAGTEVVALPTPNIDPATIVEAQRYQALDFTTDGKYRVLRGDGAVFSDASNTLPLIDLPGTASGAPGETFLDLHTTADGFFGMRWDGKVYDETGAVAIFAQTVVKADYRRFAVSTTPPDLTNFKNPVPVQAIYKSRAIEGQALTVPFLVSDIEKLPADLVLTAPDPLPPGATWDDPTRTLSWASPGPVGTYKFVTTVSDGVNAPKTFHHSIKVLAADTNTLKNKAPLPTQITLVQAQAGFPITFPIFAIDPDGDPLTISVNTAKAPFTLGATFDALTNTFSWTPTSANIGKVTAHFKVFDGKKTVTLSVTIKVVNPLIF